VSISIDINLGLRSGQSGAVVVTPDRLLTFSAMAIAGPASGQLLPAGSLAPPQLLPLQSTRYVFRINPDELQVSHEKIQKWPLTKAGFGRQYYGNSLTTFAYSGTSGVFRPDYPSVLLPDPARFDIRTTRAWQKFKELEAFYLRSGETNLFMFCVDYPHDWEGMFENFTFKRSGKDRPFEITYSFTFKGLPLLYAPTTAVTSTNAGNDAAAQAALASQQTPRFNLDS
jgi:hypothetical protein